MSLPQAAFAGGLLDPASTMPVGLVAWNGSDASRRYAVYRNNVSASLINALKDTFPVCCERIGNVIFRDLALRYARTSPPSSPLLAEYGAGFPDFVAQSEIAWLLPEISDLAHLEWLCVRAFHATDAEPLSTAALAAVLADPDRLPSLRLTPHPSVRTLLSDHAIVSIWAAYQGLIEFAAVDLALAQGAVISRIELDVEVLLAPPEVIDLIRRLGESIPLGRAAAAVLEAHADFDLAASLAYLIRHRLLSSAIHVSAED